MLYPELSDSVRRSYLTFSEIWKLVWALDPSQVWGRVCTSKANGNPSFSGRILYFKDACGTSKTKICVSLFPRIPPKFFKSFFDLLHYFSNWNFLVSMVAVDLLSPAPRISPGGRHILLLLLSCCILQAPLAMKLAVAAGGCCRLLGNLWKMPLKIGWLPVQPSQYWWKWLLHIWTKHEEPPPCPERDKWENLHRYNNTLRAQRLMLVATKGALISFFLLLYLNSGILILILVIILQ